MEALNNGPSDYKSSDILGQADSLETTIAGALGLLHLSFNVQRRLQTFNLEAELTQLLSFDTYLILFLGVTLKNLR